MISGPGMQQQYCLRWNNHKTNLLTVFGELLRNEHFTDVTLACEGGSFIKCHKVVLAACSTYFQCLFSELPCRHPVVVLKDVRYSEIHAILEYMYKGEVSITQDEVEPLLKVAEALKVKGLVGENNYKGRASSDEYNAISTSSAFGVPLSREHNVSAHSVRRSTPSPNDLSNNGNVGANNNDSNTSDNNNGNNSNGGSGGSNNGSSNKNEKNGNSSPPHSTGIHQSFQKNPHHYGKSSNSDRSGNRVSLPIWPMTGLPIATPSTPHTAAAMFNSCYEAVIAASNTDMPPLRRKKLSSFLMHRDTPILRTVLGQGQADSSQPMSLVCHTDGQDQVPQSNGPTTPLDISYIKNMKSEVLSEDAHSPYMESSFMDEDVSQDRQMNKVLHSSSSSPQSFYSESKGVSSGIATYVPTNQKPEWKRYKQYTKHDISSAIEAVRSGMSALQAARQYNVPSRTLYDKVKKMGITTSRPFRRSNGSSNGAAFPYGISGTGSGMMFNMAGDEEMAAKGGALLEHGFLQHALEIGVKKIKIDDTSDREAMSSTPPVSSHGFLQRALEIEERIKSEMGEREAISLAQGNTSGTSSSPAPNDRSPSPNLIKYAQRSSSLTPSPPPPPPDDDYEDQVEDLSMSRKPEQQSRVIMPPMNQATAAMLAACSDSGGRD